MRSICRTANNQLRSCERGAQRWERRSHQRERCLYYRRWMEAEVERSLCLPDWLDETPRHIQICGK
jgi:hypothetical protein